MLEKILATVKQGTLEGVKILSSVTGQNYYCFKGVPYAKPPVGDLRFKPPQVPDSWEGIRSATKEGNACPQFFPPTGDYMGDEDCLFLNIFTKNWPPVKPSPVMVSVHGGGFVMGSGNLGADFLVDEDVVLVTINYRLAILGFLHVEGSDATPNNGLRDQNAALKWVRENILNFGGDPSNVTLFGCSAGGTSVHYQTLAPSSRELFHRVIVQSGSAISHFCNVSQSAAMERAVRLGKVLGANTTDPQQLVDFLRNVPVKELILAQRNTLSEEERLHAFTFPFLPSEESPSEIAFIPGNPEELVKQGKFYQVPLITGVTSAEGKLLLHKLFAAPTLKEVNLNFERAFNWNLKTQLGEEKMKTVVNKIKKFYFGEKNVSEETVSKYVDLQSDLCFNYPLYKTVLYQVNHSEYPIYVYQFSKKEPEDLLLPGNNPIARKLPGADHGTDNMYLFHSAHKPVNRTEGSPEEKTTRNIVRLWTNFAKTGNPSEGLEVNWPPVEKNYFPYLDITDKLTINENLNKERMEFLEQVFTEAAQ